MMEDWGPWMLLAVGSALIAWFLFLDRWRKSGVGLYDNWGRCQYPRCDIMAYRCTGHCCGICCRRTHQGWEKHAMAVPVTGVLTQMGAGPAHTQPTPNSTHAAIASVVKAEVVDSKLPVRYGGVDNKSVKDEEPIKKEDVKPPTPGEMEQLDDAGKLVDFAATYSWQPKIFD